MPHVGRPDDGRSMNVPAPEAFFLAERPPTLMQGDVLLAPSGVLLDGAVHPAVLSVPLAPDIGGSVTVPAWQPPSAAVPPPAVQQTRYGPVLVLSHECELEKDYNAYVRQLIRDGASQAEAEQVARGTPDLDPFVLVAPLLTYAEVEAEWVPALRSAARMADVRSGARVGYFPIPPIPGLGDTEFVVPLGRAATIERRLLRPGLRLASLSDLARGALRYKLTKVFSTRDLSVLAELEAAVGQTIQQVQTTPRPKKQVAIALYLGNGEVLHLEGKPLRPALPDDMEASPITRPLEPGGG